MCNCSYNRTFSNDYFSLDNVPAVTALFFRDGLTMGLGTSTGHVLLYDLRSTKPLLIKDHQYGLPINSIAFQDKLGVVLSADSKILKIWDRETGKPFTSIEPSTDKNNLCLYPDSGLVFMATESPKMLVYYIPVSLNYSPCKYSSFFYFRYCFSVAQSSNFYCPNRAVSTTHYILKIQRKFCRILCLNVCSLCFFTVYDDYKFVTKQDLESLGLAHLMGTNLLRAYMHGYFIDMRLYHKAKSIAEPFAFEEYRKKRIQDKIEEERANRVKLKKLPKVNRNLAEKLIEEKRDTKKHTVSSSDVSNPLGDDRFSAMFLNPDFQVDEESEEYKLLHPVVSKHEREKQKRQKEKQKLLEQFDEIEVKAGKNKYLESEISTHFLVLRKSKNYSA
ncbi:nucleolar protein 10-like [Porites lutea]|uniref:nucleolar protein 10-like n=1 Tax=Porites lutea TaxID=51062 RepID=UPI003CC55D6F